MSCCVTTYSAGAAQYQQILGICMCAQGVCLSECSGELCATPPRSITAGGACDNCVRRQTDTTGACTYEVASDCSFDTDCPDYLACVNGCP